MKVSDKVFIAPTDTVYGIIASAFSKEGIKRIYKIKGRDKHKKLIILISKISDIKLFRQNISSEQEKFLKKIWPNPVTVAINKNYSFRIPKNNKQNKKILDLINKYGPLVAPSANRQAEKTVETIREAKKLFENSVDFYISNGRRLNGKSSTLVKLNKDGSFEILRQGNYKLKL